MLWVIDIFLDEGLLEFVVLVKKFLMEIFFDDCLFGGVMIKVGGLVCVNGEGFVMLIGVFLVFVSLLVLVLLLLLLFLKGDGLFFVSVVFCFVVLGLYSIVGRILIISGLSVGIYVYVIFMLILMVDYINESDVFYENEGFCL